MSPKLVTTYGYGFGPVTTFEGRAVMEKASVMEKGLITDDPYFTPITKGSYELVMRLLQLWMMLEKGEGWTGIHTSLITVVTVVTAGRAPAQPAQPMAVTL